MMAAANNYRLAAQFRRTRNLVWRAVALGIALLVVNAKKNTWIVCRISSWEADS